MLCLNKGHVQKVLGVVSKGIYQQKEWQKECISAVFNKPNGNVKSCNLILKIRTKGCLST